MSRPLRKFTLAFAVLATILALGWFLGPSGRVSGVEFSPDTISHRSFTYFQWCGIQCTPRRQDEWQSDVDAYLHEFGYVTPTDRKRWHFVKGFAPGVRGWHGHAKYMCQSIGCWGGDDQLVKWSRDNPELAAVVWPQVISWARQEKYYEIMYLFRFAELEDATSADDVESKIAFSIANVNS